MNWRIVGIMCVALFFVACDGAVPATKTDCRQTGCDNGEVCLPSGVCAPGDAQILDSSFHDGSLNDGMTDVERSDGGLGDIVKSDGQSSSDGSTSDSNHADSGGNVDTIAPDTCAVVCNGICCASGEICHNNFCIPAGSDTCQDNDDCGDDEYCFDGQCIPYGHGPNAKIDPQCLRVIPAGVFAPSLQCEWKAPPAGDTYPNHRNVLGTPTVITVDRVSEPIKTRIIFVSYDREDGGSESNRCDNGAFGVIRVISGSDCEQVQTLDTYKVRASTPLAVADIDGDSYPDIVALACGGGLVAYSFNNTTKAFEPLWRSNPSTLFGSTGLWSGPSIHDLDNDSKPEILVGGYVFDAAGQLLDAGHGLLSYASGTFPVVADVDKDGIVELVTGDFIFEWEANTTSWQIQATTGQPRGHVAIADFGTFGSDPTKDDRSTLDGIAEVAVGTSGYLRILTLEGRVVYGPVALPGGGTGGPPTIGDFDKDGRAEVALAGRGSYTVFDMDCTGTPNATTCPTQTTTGILWTRPSQDHSSSSTGSSVFDFEGDGKAEAIYADECFTRVYDGSTGEVVYSQYHTSCTWYENPIVADVDGDYKSELVVPSNTNCTRFDYCRSRLPALPSDSSLPMDDLFAGLRCKTNADCLSNNCNNGFCRCTADADCGSATDSFRCGPMISGTPGTGNVCRSVMLGPVQGIRVYRDMQDRWVDSRPIWNQHAYSVTNIGDFGEVPKTSSWLNNWEQQGLNNFRQNVQGVLDPSAVPDLTSNMTQGISCGASAMTVNAQVCNRGTKKVAPGVPVAVYLGTTSSAPLGCTTATLTTLDPGDCEKVSCDITPLPTSAIDLRIVADDDGTGKGANVECYDENNWSIIEGVSCAPW